jgi:hypothetical protein
MAYNVQHNIHTRECNAARVVAEQKRDAYRMTDGHGDACIKLDHVPSQQQQHSPGEIELLKALLLYVYWLPMIRK